MLRTEQWAKAEAILSLLVKSETTNASVLPDARLSLGIALEALKQVPEALQQYNSIVAEKNPAVGSACDDSDRGDSVCGGTV